MKAVLKIFKGIVFFLFVYFPLKLSGQVNDCITAGIICDGGLISYTPSGPGIDDFQSPFNDKGCLQEGERQSAWYYFEFMPNMPPNSTLEIAISPVNTNTNLVDFDFAIFGSNVKCDGLGSPLRCSFAFSNCANCPFTGLGRGANDFSEGANGDGFLAPLVVQPGDGFYLLIDNWLANTSGYNLEWGGTAASFLNCNADPNCPIIIDLGQNFTTCVNPGPIQLNSQVEETTGTTVYKWSSENNDHIAFLSNPNIANPILTPPANFIGILKYHLTVADNRCVASQNLTITISNEFAPEITGPDKFCQNTPAILDAGQGFSKYFWSTGEKTQKISITKPGIYGVTVTSTGGCTSIDTIGLFNPLPSPVPPSISGDTILCNNASGAIRVPNIYHTYKWSHGPRDPGTLITKGGTYGITVTNEAGCPAYDSILVMKIDAIAEQIDLGPNKEICFNETITLDAGEQFISYVWDNGHQKIENREIKIDAAGLYCATVYDKNGCKSQDCIVISEIETPKLFIDGFPGFCKEGTTLTVGSDFDAYQWSTGSMEKSIFVNKPGVYGLTVTDGICKDTIQIPVTQGVGKPPLIEGPTSICSNQPARLIAETGYSSYIWSDGTQGRSISITQPGQIVLNVVDQEGCPSQQVLNIKEAQLPVVDISGPENICPNDSIQLEVTGNFEEVLWSNGFQGNAITISSPGIYALLAKGSSGCEVSVSKNVQLFNTKPPIINGDQTFCEGDFVTFSISQPYKSYYWSTGETSDNIRINRPGIYSLSVEDENGCIVSNELEAIQLEVPNISIPNNYYLCSGSTLLIDAGPDKFSYNWSTGHQTNSITISEPGTYIVEATNEIGCSDKAGFSVIEIPSPQPIVLGDTILCSNESTILSLDNPYLDILWQDGSKNATYQAMKPGIYTVTVTDNNGCKGSNSIQIKSGNFTDIQISGDRSFCKNSSTTLIATSDFSKYYWSTGDTTSQITISTPGSYKLTVYTDDGCETDSEVTVIQIPLPDPGLPSSLTLCPNEEITLSANNGFENYNWSVPGNKHQILIDKPGWYFLNVKDEEGCENMDSVFVSESSGFESLFLDKVDPSCFNASDGWIEISGINPNNYFFRTVFDNMVISDAPILNNLKAGTYLIEIEDEYHCKLDTFIELNNGNHLEVSLGEDKNIPFGSTIEIVPKLNQPLTDMHIWEWTSDQPLSCPNCWVLSLDGNQTTSLTLKIEDQNGCIASDSIKLTVEIPDQVFIPNVFSPNNDGLNDFFMIHAGEEVKTIKYLNIYDRWGSQVFVNQEFQPNNPYEGWDGRQQFRDCQVGVYAYIAEIEFIDGTSKTYKGDVTILK